ncbi:hypothetical protein BRADI_4g20640v3 [Brachypodium distachyon]|uniref:DNA replication licensing factor MCM2-like winged-helix domain-containing protein n=1 Tax=Brachypodium distachyon TaxID=15368 RepID=I1IM39_BRADI|nr:hypothetical protein BRADI_4g20640v3 [Brachypodium distachyon]
MDRRKGSGRRDANGGLTEATALRLSFEDADEVAEEVEESAAAEGEAAAAEVIGSKKTRADPSGVSSLAPPSPRAPGVRRTSSSRPRLSATCVSSSRERLPSSSTAHAACCAAQTAAPLVAAGACLSAQSFHKYMTYKKDYNELLLLLLRTLVKDVLHFEEIMSGSTTRLTHIEVKVDDLGQEFEIYDLKPFFSSSHFSDNNFVLDEGRGITKHPIVA